MGNEGKKSSGLLSFAIDITLKFIVWLTIPFLLVFLVGEYIDKTKYSFVWVKYLLYGVAFMITSIGLAFSSCKAMACIDEDYSSKNKKRDVSKNQ